MTERGKWRRPRRRANDMTRLTHCHFERTFDYAHLCLRHRRRQGRREESPFLSVETASLAATNLLHVHLRKVSDIIFLTFE